MGVYGNALFQTLAWELTGLLLWLPLLKACSRWYTNAPVPPFYRYVTAIIVINLITHPLFWLLYPQVSGIYPYKLYGFEMGIAMTEGVFYGWYFKRGYGEGIILSIYLNSLSLWFGVV
jgi:hypothetical protein